MEEAGTVATYLESVGGIQGLDADVATWLEGIGRGKEWLGL